MSFDQIKLLAKQYLAVLTGVGTAAVMSIIMGISNKVNNGGVFNFRNPIAKTLNSELRKLNKNAKEEAEGKLKADALKALSNAPTKKDIVTTYGSRLEKIDDSNSQIGDKIVAVVKEYANNLGSAKKSLFGGISSSSTYNNILNIEDDGTKIFKDASALLGALQGTYDEIVKNADKQYNKEVEDFLKKDGNQKKFDDEIKRLKEEDDKKSEQDRQYVPEKIKINNLNLSSMFDLNDGKLTPKKNG